MVFPRKANVLAHFRYMYANSSSLTGPGKASIRDFDRIDYWLIDCTMVKKILSALLYGTQGPETASTRV